MGNRKGYFKWFVGLSAMRGRGRGVGRDGDRVLNELFFRNYVKKQNKSRSWTIKFGL